MTLIVSDEKFTYEQAREFLTDYWYWNPQEISCFEEKYLEVARFEQRLPISPSDNFYSPDYFFAFSSLFGEEFFTFDEIVEFCSYAFQKNSGYSQLVGLKAFYKELRLLESRMPSAPEQFYGVSSIRMLFGLSQIAFFTYQEAEEFCTQEYGSLPSDQKPAQLTLFYKKLTSKGPVLPSTPERHYKGTGWVSYRVLFGLEDIVYLSYEDAFEYCSEEYKKISDNEKPSDLGAFYSTLRDENLNLPSTPSAFYKNKGWVSWRALFELEEKVLFSYLEAVEYCSKKYHDLSGKKKPTNLTKFYLELRGLDLRLPRAPGQAYKNKGWVSFKELFNANEKVFLTCEEAVAFCTKKYEECPVNEKPSNLRKFYKLLRASEPRLPGSPEEKYKSKGWKSIRAMFSLV
ncbi:MAG: hypothetical protein U9N57_09560 [Pseudomonadota bacterium]|nr:hypothetical protein [Pseudomonadota bacterium]